MPLSHAEGREDAWEIMSNLWRLMQLIMDESSPGVEELGLSIKAFFLLASVEDVPFPAELARLMHLPPPTVTYMVKQLEALKLIERRPEPGDLRKFRLVLTPGGREAIGQGRKAIGTVVAERLSRLASDEVDVLDRLVATLAGGSSAGH